MSKDRKRNITDEEIALIKAMLRRKIPNDRIHFYFNRADRLVSSGRIAQIKGGKYGKGVPEGTQAAVDTFWLNGKKAIRRYPLLTKSPVLPRTTT